jgi:hypothetical protein
MSRVEMLPTLCRSAGHPDATSIRWASAVTSAPVAATPRPIGELLLEVAAGRDLLEALEEYSRLDAAAVERLEAREWPATMWAVSA